MRTGRNGSRANGKAKASGKVKHKREPAKLVPLPVKNKGKQRLLDDTNTADNDGSYHAAQSQDEEEELMIAEQMVGDGSDSSQDDSDDEARGTSAERDKSIKAGQNGSTIDRNVNFLTSLDVEAISTSRAEQARLKKQEKTHQKAEMKALAKLQSAGKPKKPKSKRYTDGASDSEDYDSFTEADLENAEMDDLSDFDDEDLPDIDLGEDDDEEEDDEEDITDSESTGSSDEEEGQGAESSDEEAREDRLAQKIALQAKRKRMEMEAVTTQKAKKSKLPVRGQDGWMSSDTELESEEGDAQEKVETNRVTKPSLARENDDMEEDEERREEIEPSRKSDVATGNRFGMLAPYAIMQLRSPAQRIGSAQEQIAQLAQSILSDPEVSGLGFLKRMTLFARAKVARPAHMEEDGAQQPQRSKKTRNPNGDSDGDEEEEEEDEDEGSDEDNTSTKLPVDLPIRAAALLSLMAVYVDILPGYRIRPLTDAEQAETVGQDVQRRRDFEQGIVGLYREYLELCERQVKGKHELSGIALKALTTLLLRAPHFNYRTNIIRTVVSRLSRSGWDQESSLCSSSLIQLLRQDRVGDLSLEVVRLLHRMIKERRYRVNAKILDILLHLRLKDELGSKRASTTRSDNPSKGEEKKAVDRKAKPTDVRKGTAQHLSKKQVKKMREVKEIEKEMREADATVDLEERERNQTETLKLLFVLYFSILKSPAVSSSLLGSALEGLAMFAHRINVDFFRDLLAVLREHVARARAVSLRRNQPVENEHDDDEAGNGSLKSAAAADRRIRDSLLCLVTAFELLDGQGEALNIDLSDFASHLYGVMLQLSTVTDLEEAVSIGNKSHQHLRSSSDLLFRALELALLRPRVSSVSSERAAAFVKRMLSCSLHWSSPTTVIRCLRMIKVLVVRDPKLAALFDGEDRAHDGGYDPTQEQVDAVRPLASGETAWEVEILRNSVNADVRAEAEDLLAAVADALR